MFGNDVKKFYNYLKKKDELGHRIIFLTTSNRWEGSGEKPKSTMFAQDIAGKLANCEVLDVSKLKIFPCEGNVSRNEENRCGLKESLLKDKKKNPHGIIRCWASLNNPTDEMYVVANKIYESDIIVFFGSVRWGKMNAIYSHLMERLTWLEARHSSLGESNLIKDKETGIVAFGHNWNGQNVVQLEKDGKIEAGITKDEILDTIESAVEQITIALMQDEFDIYQDEDNYPTRGVRAGEPNRFVIRNKKTNLNIVCQLESGDWEFTLTVITVMKKPDFKEYKGQFVVEV